MPTPPLVEPAFRAVAALRHARVFHPHGVLFGARWAGTCTDPAEATPVLRAGFTSDALVRLSRGVGLPEPLPDVLGVAVKLPAGADLEQEQDLLLASVLETPVGVHVFRPASDFTEGTYSTLVPHLVGGRPRVVGARTAVRPGAGFSLRTAPRSAPGWRLTIMTARPGGRWAPVAVLELGDPVDGPDVDFDALHDGGGIAQPPVLAGLRAAAYRGSRAGRPEGDRDAVPAPA